MKSRLLLLLIIFLPLNLLSDTYNEALKYEALGNSEKALEYFHDYFKKNINDVNQDNIIEKLLYSSTLLPTIDDSIDFLTFYVKYMENENSRHRIYIKIAEIYELSGRIYDAGIYYEKAAYTISNFIDYDSLISSYEMLIDLGVYNSVKTSILSHLENIKESELRDRCYFILSRVYYFNGEINKSIQILKNVSEVSGKSEFYKYEFGGENNLGTIDSKNLEKIVVYSPKTRLKTPSDYIGKISVIDTIPELSLKYSERSEIYIGNFKNREAAAGIVNISNQMGLPWFFDEVENGYNLYLFSENRVETIEQLKKLGIIVK